MSDEIELNEGQRSAVETLMRNLLNGVALQFFAGKAGTGKTTSVKVLHAKLELLGFNVAVCAPTHKAKKVLQRKGLEDATTLHGGLFKSPTSEGSIKRAKQLVADIAQLRASGAAKKLIEQKEHELSEERRKIEDIKFAVNKTKRPNVIILDECSMVSAETMSEITALNIPIVAVGDYNQLPPVKGTQFFGLEEGQFPPTVELTEIVRQKKGDPITLLAHAVIAGEQLSYGPMVIPESHLTAQKLISVDQVVCHTHRKRRQVASIVRPVLFPHSMPNSPVPGDRLIARATFRGAIEAITLGYTNTYHIESIFNSSQWIVHYVEREDRFFVLILQSAPENGKNGRLFVRLKAHACQFWGEQPKPEDKHEAVWLDYAYAITTHAAQGSEWQNVIYIKEPFASPQLDYTAITRAQNSLIVAK